MSAIKQKPTDFRIVSAPEKIEFECPRCGEHIEIPWRNVDAPASWSDTWSPAVCPECGKSVDLGEWEYD